MSAYIMLATPMIDQNCVLAALADLGFGAEKVEVHQDAVPLTGYQGRNRKQRANIVIRRQFVGSASNDIGFERTATGFRAYVSGFDHPRFGGNWLSQLNSRYQHHHQEKVARLAEEERQRLEEARRQLVEAQRQEIHKKARKMGYRVQETRENNKVRLVLVKRVY